MNENDWKDSYILDIKWEVANMPPLVGPSGSIAEANDFAKINIPNGTWEVRPLKDPYLRAVSS